MKTELHYAYTTVAAVITMLFIPLSGSADPAGDLHRLSEEMEDIVDELDDQFEDHYEDSRGYQSLNGYLRGVELRRKKIHRLSRNRVVSPQLVQQELAGIAQLNTNMRALVNQLENEAGRYALRLFGDTRGVHIELGNLSRNIQSMQRAASRIGLGSGYTTRNYYNTSPQYSYPTQSYSTRSYYQQGYANRQPNGSSHHNHSGYTYPNSSTPPPAPPSQNVPPNQNAAPSQNLNPLQKLHQKHIQLRNAIFGRH